MARYISIDDAIKIAGKALPGDTYKALDVAIALEDAPDADVVELVCCKDCKYWHGKDYDGVCFRCGLATRYANEFCSRGERKDDDGSEGH